MKFVSKSFDELTTTELYEILKSRSAVFIVEKGMNCQDMDDTDYISRHIFLEEDQKVVAYLRAFCKCDSSDTVKIGRVLTLNHGAGLGKKLMELSIEEIKKIFKCKKISLSSQLPAVGFYEKFGFKVVSDEFTEEGVLHVKMELEL